jgi:hypothetical protein
MMNNVAGSVPLDTLRETALLEAMAESGCPLCRSIWRDDRRSQTWYVNDGAVDHKTLVRVRRALGFCGWHAVTLVLLEGHAYIWSHLGSALLYQDIWQQRVLPALQRSRPHRAHGLLWSGLWPFHLARLRLQLASQEACPVCADAAHIEAEQIATFSRALATHSTFRASYSASDGLCLPHLFKVMEHLATGRVLATVPGELRATLVQPTRRRISHMGRFLKGYRGKLALSGTIRLLFGANTFLWAAHQARLDLDGNESEWRCAACAYADALLMRACADLLAAPVLPHLCDWHGWFLYRFAVSAGVEPLFTALDRTVAAQLLFLDAQGASLASPQQLLRSCALCVWGREREAALVREWWRDRHAGLEVSGYPELCLPHGRLLLGQLPALRLSRAAALALCQCAEHLSEQLAGYISHCSEHQQASMQPAERRAWQDSVRWFGGLMGNETLKWFSHRPPHKCGACS